MFSKRAEFETLVHSYSAELYRYAYYLSRDRLNAEDLVQETFARAWGSWTRLRDVKAAKKWLYTILRHEHARMYERKRLEFVDAQDLDALETVSIAGSVELEVRQALEGLPQCYRETLLLQVVCGFTCEEIAKIMNLTVGATMTRLSRARFALRKASAAPGGKEMSA